MAERLTEIFFFLRYVSKYPRNGFGTNQILTMFFFNFWNIWLFFKNFISPLAWSTMKNNLNVWKNEEKPNSTCF